MVPGLDAVDQGKVGVLMIDKHLGGQKCPVDYCERLMKQ